MLEQPQPNGLPIILTYGTSIHSVSTLLLQIAVLILLCGPLKLSPVRIFAFNNSSLP